MHKDQRLIQSENAIIEAGIRTLISNPAASMSDIAAAAGVGRATLYRHFDSKEVLIQHLAVICLREINSATESISHLKGCSALEATIDAVMPIADRFRFLTSLWGMFFESEKVNQIIEMQHKEIYEMVNDAKRKGEINESLPTKWIASIFDGTLAVAWELLESGDVTPNEAAEYAKQTFFNGCKQSI